MLFCDKYSSLTIWLTKEFIKQQACSAMLKSRKNCLEKLITNRPEDIRPVRLTFSSWLNKRHIQFYVILKNTDGKWINQCIQCLKAKQNKVRQNVANNLLLGCTASYWLGHVLSLPYDHPTRTILQVNPKAADWGTSRAWWVYVNADVLLQHEAAVERAELLAQDRQHWNPWFIW